MRSFGDNIYNDNIIISKVDKMQSSILNSILEFNNRARLRSKSDNEKKAILMKV